MQLKIISFEILSVLERNQPNKDIPSQDEAEVYLPPCQQKILRLYEVLPNVLFVIHEREQPVVFQQ